MIICADQDMHRRCKYNLNIVKIFEREI